MRTHELLSRSIAIAAAPPAVLGLIGDPRTAPRWAPRFADSVRPAAGGRWTVSSGGEEFEIRVRSSPDAGTVDFLARDEDRGLFARVVPNGAGSALVLTLIIPAGTPGDVIERECVVLEQELQAVRALCEA